MDVLTKVPVREQEATVRAKNFDEVCLGYNKEEAMEEATRCINCKNAQCIKGSLTRPLIFTSALTTSAMMRITFLQFQHQSSFCCLINLLTFHRLVKIYQMSIKFRAIHTGKFYFVTNRDLYVTTDDGSYGRKGMVTQTIQELVDEGKKYDLCIAMRQPPPPQRESSFLQVLLCPR
mgnify:CR=1 FL=1